jgi:plasmid stabilization system protein ParE
VTKVAFDPLAEAELGEAVAYYDGISSELGDALLEETDRVVEQLLEFPLSVPVWREDLRRRPLFRFPYALVYRIDGELIYVVAVLHQARGPNHIARRVSDYLKSR